MSGLFRSISKQKQSENASNSSSTTSLSSNRETITDQFSKGRLDTKGSFLHLSLKEDQVLAEFWARLLADFSTPLDKIDSNPVARPVDCDDKAEREKATKTPPFEVFEGCMFNETVADKCVQLGIAEREDDLVPEFRTQRKDDSLGSAFWSVVREDYPDALILRFLRARKWDLEKAYRMAVAAVKWRVAEDVEEIIWYGDVRNDASLMWKGVSYAHGKDKLGHPVVWSGSYLHHQKDQSYPQLKRYLIWMMESLRQLLSPPTERVCLIMDLTDHSNANMDWPFVKTFLKFLEAYYPECLAICIVYNGPWWFSGIWKMISPLLDPVVAAKVQFAQKPEGLLKYIDESELLKIRGGKNEYEYEYVKPKKEENEKMFDSEARERLLKEVSEARAEFVNITNKWIEAKDNDAEFEKVGKERLEVSGKLRELSLDFDQYTRARHFYHRTGVLDRTKVDWSVIQDIKK